MTQADAEDGDFLSQGGYDFCDNAGFFRSSGAGRENDLIGRQPGDFLYRHLIIADHPDIGFNFSDELVEIIGKTVIIIDEQNHILSSSASSSAFITAFALLMHSSYSLSGTESATIPAPDLTKTFPFFL